jgi:hypothetical protein
VKDKLAELGYRLRPRKVKSEPSDPPGAVRFDERGNAVYQWRDDSLADDSEAAERAREKALMHPGLSLVDEELPPQVAIQPNPKGLRHGYNPYESGMLDKKERKAKRNLRELSKWIEAKRLTEQKKDAAD